MTLPGKATHQQTRGFNRGLVLRTLYDYGPVSRAEVARLTGLTRTTVSELVVGRHRRGPRRARSGSGPSSGGKAPILLQVVDDARLVVAVDLGERVFAGALVNLRGEVRATREVPADGLDGDEALAALIGLVDALVDARARHQPDPRHRRRHAGPRRRDHRHDPLGGQPRLAGPAAGARSSPSGPACRRTSPTTRRAAALAEYLFEGRRRAAEPGRDQGRPRHRRRHRDRGRALQRRRLRGRRDRPYRGRRRRRRVPLRPLRLPRDRGQLSGDRPGRDRGRRREPGLGACATPERVRRPDPERRRGGARRRATRPRAGSWSPRAARSASRSPALIGAINIGRVVLLGSVTALGEPWLDGGPRRGLAPVARPARRRDADRDRPAGGQRRDPRARPPC